MKKITVRLKPGTTYIRWSLLIVALLSLRLDAQQVTFDRILRAASEPQNWLT